MIAALFIIVNIAICLFEAIFCCLLATTVLAVRVVGGRLGRGYFPCVNIIDHDFDRVFFIDGVWGIGLLICVGAEVLVKLR